MNKLSYQKPLDDFSPYLHFLNEMCICCFYNEKKLKKIEAEFNMAFRQN